jgi:hypothetical protein
LVEHGRHAQIVQAGCKEGEKMNIRQGVIVLFIGVALGAAGAMFLPKVLAPYLPDSLAGRTATVRGTVMAKEKKPASLLLTVNTPQGALLATFSRDVDATDLLVGPNDTVDLRIKRYEPFVEDPKIMRVVKAGSAADTLSTQSGATATLPTPTGVYKVPAGKKEHRPEAGG